MLIVEDNISGISVAPVTTLAVMKVGFRDAR